MSVRFYTFQDKRSIEGPAVVMAHLRTAWESKKAVMKGDPAQGQSVTLGKFTALFHSWRQEKYAGFTLPKGLQAEHQRKNCYLCKPDVIEKQGLAYAEVNGRNYLVLLNFRPNSMYHMMVVRSPEEEPASLSQHVQTETDLKDVAEIFGSLSGEVTATFNSNPGENEQSGASVNHFHWHLFLFDAPLTKTGYVLNPLFRNQRAQGTNIGRILRWPANHRVFEGSLDAATSIAFQYIQGLEEQDRAYNLGIIKPTSPGMTKLVVTPRRHSTPLTPFKEIPPYAGFGGETVLGLIGGEISQTLFDTLKKYPEEAERAIEIWLEEITARDGEMTELDQQLLRRLS